MDVNNLLTKKFSDFHSILNELQDYDGIKYAAYRTAAKLHLLQNALFMDKLPLQVISNVYERHNLHHTENFVQLYGKELEPVLHDIYFVIRKEHYFNLEIGSSVQMMMHFLFHVFDKKKKGSVQVLSAKIGLVVLCAAKPREKYQYLFSQLADHNSCLSKKKLEILLKRMLNVTESLKEETYFRSDLIPGTVESCFLNNVGTLGISENDFIAWLVQDPQILVWFSTLYRIQLSEIVSHNAKCDVCNVYPMIGLRYRCLKCLCYNQCQKCFFTGKINKKHKLTHPVQEYCFPLTSRQSTKAFLLTLRNRLLKSSTKLQYLPAPKVNFNSSATLEDSTRLLDEMEISSRTVLNGLRVSIQSQPQKELQNIILQLEKESQKIVPQFEKLCAKQDFDNSECRSELKKCLINHKDKVEELVERLKLLKHCLGGDPKSLCLLESTPVVGSTNGHLKINLMDNEFEGISPIAIRKRTGDRHLSLRRTMWGKRDMVGETFNISWKESNTVQYEPELEKKSDTMIDNALHKSNNDTVSTLLGGSALKELEHSTNKGLTCWLKPESQECNSVQIDGNPNDVDALKLQNEKYFRDVEYDLEKIFEKLEKLTMNCSSKRESICGKNYPDEDSLSDTNELLLGLINGIDKLINN